MEYEVIVNSLSSLIDELVTIKIGGTVIDCFDQIGYPGNLFIGDIYHVDIQFRFFNDFHFRECKHCTPSFERINESLAYYIRGIFNFESRLIKSNIDIILPKEEIDLCDYGYLDGKFVELRVDRIDIEFID